MASMQPSELVQLERTVMHFKCPQLDATGHLRLIVRRKQCDSIGHGQREWPVNLLGLGVAKWDRLRLGPVDVTL